MLNKALCVNNRRCINQFKVLLSWFGFPPQETHLYNITQCSHHMKALTSNSRQARQHSQPIRDKAENWPASRFEQDYNFQPYPLWAGCMTHWSTAYDKTLKSVPDTLAALKSWCLTMSASNITSWKEQLSFSQKRHLVHGSLQQKASIVRNLSSTQGCCLQSYGVMSLRFVVSWVSW